VAAMKVCMVVHQAYEYDSRVRRYAESLAARGVAVDVLCLDAAAPPSPPLPNVRLRPIPLRRGRDVRWRRLLEYGAALALFVVRAAALQVAERYDVVHIHNMPDLLVLAALLPRLLGARIILDIHDPMPEFYMSKYRAGPRAPVVRLMRLQERLACALAHAVIASNTAFRDNLVRRGIPADKIAVVTNVPDDRVFARHAHPRGGAREDGRFALIYPGTIAPRYGLEVAIRALPRLIPHIPGMELVILGGQTEHASELARLADELGVGGHLRLEPPVSLHEVPARIARADLGIYPALPDAHMSIAIPSKVLEFAMMGVPVVASRLPALQHLFPDTAIRYVEPGDPDALARAILDLYRRPDAAAAMVHEADRAFVAARSWDHEFDVYLGVLNGHAGELAASRRAGAPVDNGMALAEERRKEDR